MTATPAGRDVSEVADGRSIQVGPTGEPGVNLPAQAACCTPLEVPGTAYCHAPQDVRAQAWTGTSGLAPTERMAPEYGTPPLPARGRAWTRHQAGSVRHFMPMPRAPRPVHHQNGCSNLSTALNPSGRFSVANSR